MKVKFPLYLQTAGMLFLYLATLSAIAFICFNAQFGIGYDALFNSPVGDRFDTIADAVSSQLQASPRKNWNEILKRFNDLYSANFIVIDFDGKQIGGAEEALPQALVARLHQFPHPPLPHFSFSPEDRFRHHEHFRNDHGPDDFPPVGFALPAPDGGIILERSEKPGGGPMGPPPDFMPPPGEHAGLPELRHSHARFLLHTEKPNKYWFTARFFIREKDQEFTPPYTLIASTDNLWQSTLLLDFPFLAFIFASILALSVLFWMPFIYRITKALSQLSKATERIAEGRFDIRLEAKGADEISQLSQAVNTMASRLSNFVTGQKRFLGDISHELFTPIARLQMAVELINETATPEQTALIEDVREEIEEMTNLVNELLAFSKAGMQGQKKELAQVNLLSVIEPLVNKLSIQKQTNINVNGDCCVLADKLLLERSLSNIFRNSIRYGGKGTIMIDCSRLGETVDLTITDSGPGVPEEALAHLGEPFFRPEASRNRGSGGFGLGLAIVKSCIEACKGKIVIANREGPQSGLRIKISLKACD
ncbi:MAG: HAMP domain-containing sensor histidine kinase [Candidatus Obscuribacterales bacterium]|nr:HAMP domain-containing sensor histidine kinase [Candidatus Obscuribacterales bacterium]